MNRNYFWAFSTVALLVLTACSNTPVAPAPESSPATPAATTPAATTSETKPEKKAETPDSKAAKASPGTNPTQAGFTGLKEVVAKTKREVEAKNFTQALKEFDEFEEYWEKVEDGVKAQSKDTYKSIEDDMDNITNGLKAPKPDQAKVVANLDSLAKTLDGYVKR